jgi:N,N'-diacetyllegionaminate synthase
MNRKVIIIAEAGVNHNGKLEIAKKLVEEAAFAGADYVKFQTFKADKISSVSAKKAEYQKINADDDDDSQYNLLKKLELSDEFHFKLIEHCDKHGIKFLSSAFDMDSIDFLASMQLGVWKIPSGEITNFPYLKKIAQRNEPVILSTGMCNMMDIENAMAVLLKFGVSKSQITILHCNTEYPTPMEDVNLKAMLSIADHFNTDIGYSDHTNGIEVPVAAVALGATIIEKHFTLNKNMEGPDHKASLEPLELKAMVKAIRNVEMALSGNGIKEPSKSEIKNIEIARKSIVASKNIATGDVFCEENLTVKRPGNGLNPMLWESVIGQRSNRDYLADELIEFGNS